MKIHLRSALFLLLVGSLAACSAAQPRSSGIKPGEARQELVEGNQRFLEGGMRSHAWHDESIMQTGTFGQSPSIGVLSCADSRVPTEIIFDQGVGDLFVVRNAGNFRNDSATGTFEYGVEALGVHSILVLGHTKCGAVKATLVGEPLPGHMSVITAAIQPALAKMDRTAASDDENPEPIAADEANVRWQMKQLIEGSELLQKALADGRLTMLGGIYDVETGGVRFLD